MTVTSKWVALHEVSDYLAKGWREVQIIGGPDDAALMVSPEEPASKPAKVECPNCLQKVPGELEHWHSGYSDDNCTVGPHYICAQSSPVWQEVQPANAHARSSLPGTNSGHGHAWPRPDGIKARCGGVGLCKICSADALLVKVSISEPARPEPVAAEMPEAGKVGMPAELEALLRTFASGQGINVARLREICRAVFSELDAAEGRK